MSLPKHSYAISSETSLHTEVYGTIGGVGPQVLLEQVFMDGDTLAWATGTRVGAGDHATELFCSEYGCVLGLYSDTLRFEV